MKLVDWIVVISLIAFGASMVGCKTTQTYRIGDDGRWVPDREYGRP